MATDRIQMRRDTAARWAEVNPVLLEGEIGLVTDYPNRYKIGDGVRAWNSLPLRGFDGTVTQEIGDDPNAVMSQAAVTAAVNNSLRPLYEAAGAVYNKETGFYELNGLVDITEEQMARIYVHGRFMTTEIYTKKANKIRTSFGSNFYYINGDASVVATVEIRLSYCFGGDSNVEVACLAPSDDFGVILASNSVQSFYSCTKLKKIIGILNVKNITDFSTFFDLYSGCPSLEEIKLKRLKANVAFTKSPLLSKESILYMIQNSAATSSITITLHPTAYAMAMADSEIKSALASKTYVSLASA